MAIEGVLLQRVADIHGVAVLKVRRPVAFAESYALDSDLLVREVHVQMVALADTPRVTVVNQAARDEDGTGVVGTERLKVADDVVELPGDVAEAYLLLDGDDRLQLFGQDGACHIVLHPAAELVQSVRRKSDAGGKGVSAEVYEQVAARVNRLVDIVARDGARRTGDESVVRGGEDDGRTIVGLNQAGGGNANYAFVPCGRIDDGDMAAGVVFVLLQHLKRLVRHCVLELAPLGVVGVDGCGFLPRHRLIVGDEERDSFRAGAYASAGVDAGSDLELQVGHRDGLSFHSRHFAQAPHARQRVPVHPLQPVVRQYAVLIGEGHNVGCDGHGEELEDGQELRLVPAFAAQPRLHKFVAHAAAGQAFVGIGAVLALDIENRHRVGDGVARGVVVADNHVDTVFGGVFRLVHLLDAAVEGDDEAALMLNGVVHTLEGDAIALGVAVGDIEEEVVQVRAQDAIDERHRRGAVHVVVAIDEDAFLMADGAAQPVHRLVHVAHEHRVVLLAERRADVCACRIGGGYAAKDQQAGRGEADIQLGSELRTEGKLLPVRLPYIPLRVHRRRK